MTSILFLAADPTDATRLRLGEEFREIQEKLRLAKQREQFELHQRMAVRPADISQALLDVQPQIVHFSGHGTAAGALCFEDESGKSHPVPPDALAALFKEFSDHLHCVVLNACYSEGQANAIVEHIDYVIGMNQEIGDKAAIAFSVGFYQALGAGRTVEEAYRLGCAQIGLQNIPGHLTPVLVKKDRLATPSRVTKLEAGYTRSNPVPLGQSVIWTGRKGEQIKFTMLEFHRGEEAWCRIRDANYTNQPPPSGWEYLLFKVRVEYIREGRDLELMMADSSFVIVTSDDREYKSHEGPVVVPPAPSFPKKVYVRGSVDAWMEFPVLAGDSHPVLAYGQTIFSDEMRVWLDSR